MRLGLDYECIVAIVVVRIKIVVDADSEKGICAEGYGLMGNKYTNVVDSMEGHSNMKFLPPFFVVEVQMYSVLPHWTTVRGVWIAGICVPPVNRIPWLIEVD